MHVFAELHKIHGFNAVYIFTRINIECIKFNTKYNMHIAY